MPPPAPNAVGGGAPLLAATFSPPVPLGNAPPALASPLIAFVLIAFATLEGDGAGVQPTPAPDQAPHSAFASASGVAISRSLVGMTAK